MILRQDVVDTDRSFDNYTIGIGTAISQGIISNGPKPVVLYACSRAGKDLGLTGQGNSSDVKIVYPRLDITKSDQIGELVNKIKEEQGGVDVLINNAGVNLDNEYSLDTATQTLDTNYKGTLDVGFLFDGSWQLLLAH
jgi:carbonyl reductase 1